MAVKVDWVNQPLIFKKPAGTSRGVLQTKDTWFIKIYNDNLPSIYGMGEVSMLPDLSVDYGIDVEEQLIRLESSLVQSDLPTNSEEVYAWVEHNIPSNMPALRFAFEIAFLDLMNGGKKLIFDSTFYSQSEPIPINGLIWMGDFDVMKEELDSKIAAGFDCIKIKVGAIDFEEECTLLKYIRDRYSSDQVVLRLDANGAFLTNEVLIKLKKLSFYDIHSIEQPIRPKQPEAMSLVCTKSQIPIALDEELIGINGYQQKKSLLEELNPNFIILKPSLIGGFKATREWIEIAEDLHIGWWITSALESNIGLNAICQFTSLYGTGIPQGLGTGQLFTNNVPSPLIVEAGKIWYRSDAHWDTSALDI